MKTVRGVLVKYSPSNWIDLNGLEKSGYVFYLSGIDQQFGVNRYSESGQFFINNICTLMNDVVEFNCNEDGFCVIFYPLFMINI